MGLSNKKIKVLIVEDSAFMRKALKEILESDGTMEVIGIARNGEDGVEKARELHPDVVTMDINLPGIDGITAMQYIVNDNICPVVMVSSLTQEGASTTFEALELGAFDYIPKPGGTISLNIKNIKEEIIEKVKSAAKSDSLRRTRARLGRVNAKKEPLAKRERTQQIYKKSTTKDKKVTKAVAIGISTGGPGILSEVLSELPSDLDAAIFIVQHMPPSFTNSFANRLNNNCSFNVKEANAGDIVQKSECYLAKGGYHLLLRKKSTGDIQIRLSTIPQCLFVPSVDIMMESVLEIFGQNTVGVIMTGMGDDGVKAMKHIKNSGGITIAESEETAIVFGMPMEAIKIGAADIVAPNYKIAREIIKAVDSL